LGAVFVSISLGILREGDTCGVWKILDPVYVDVMGNAIDGRTAFAFGVLGCSMTTSTCGSFFFSFLLTL
jgi:hypothetical protein